MVKSLYTVHCTLIVSKCKQRLFFLRLLNSFGVKNDILHVLYTSMIESIICYNISLWWSSMTENDKKALNRITKHAAKVTQSELTYIDDLYCNTVTKKVKCIVANSCHALHRYYASVSILGFENCQSFFSYNCPCTYGVPQCAAHRNAQRAPV